MCFKSSFHGIIKEVPGICVDNFEGQNLNCRAFFLSHCHSDHTQGLYRQELAKSIEGKNVYIYMSKLSAAIVADECKSASDYRIMKNVKILKLETHHIKLPEIFGYKEEYISVTVIPAGHCFGSVMFLFSTVEKKILYTGDFRITQNDVKNMGQLHDDNGEPVQIDVMYIDTTFMDKAYSEFPKRGKCIDRLLKNITKWLKDKNGQVALSTSAKYGYEFLFKNIFDSLNMKIFISEQRWAFYSQFPDLKQCLTNVESDSKIHLCSHISEKGNHSKCGVTQTDEVKFLFIRLSAMKWHDYDPEESALKQVSENRTDICFPTHCSRNELIYFVNYFSPKVKYGFPNKYVDGSDFYMVHNLGRKLSPAQNLTIRKPSKKQSKHKLGVKVKSEKLKEIFSIDFVK